eukprot:g2963.t1
MSLAKNHQAPPQAPSLPEVFQCNISFGIANPPTVPVQYSGLYFYDSLNYRQRTDYVTESGTVFLREIWFGFNTTSYYYFTGNNSCAGIPFGFGPPKTNFTSEMTYVGENWILHNNNGGKMEWVNANTWIRQPDDFAFAYWEKGVKEPKLLQFGGSQKLPTRMMFQYFNMEPKKLSNDVFQLPLACLKKDPEIPMLDINDLERIYTSS